MIELKVKERIVPLSALQEADPVFAPVEDGGEYEQVIADDIVAILAKDGIRVEAKVVKK